MKGFLNQNFSLIWFMNKKKLSCLEKKLCRITSDETIIGEYALGKIRLFNVWALNQNDLKRAYDDTITLCELYIEILKKINIS